MLAAVIATAEHGLAAVYIGVSVAFGSRIVAWADARFALSVRGRAAGSAPAARGARAHPP